MLCATHRCGVHNDSWSAPGIRSIAWLLLQQILAYTKGLFFATHTLLISINDRSLKTAKTNASIFVNLSRLSYQMIQIKTSNAKTKTAEFWSPDQDRGLEGYKTVYYNKIRSSAIQKNASGFTLFRNVAIPQNCTIVLIHFHVPLF